MIGALLVTAFANDKDEIVKNREDQIKERRTFFKEKIKPKVDAQRNKLDASIAAEDKKEVKRLREEIINQMLIENEFLFEARESHIKGEAYDEDLMLEIKAQRIVIENLRDEAKIIANKYRSEIDELLAEIDDDRKEWSEHMRPNGDEFRGRNRSNNQRGPHSTENAHTMGRRFGHGSRPELGLVTFLLWDVNRG